MHPLLVPVLTQLIGMAAGKLGSRLFDRIFGEDDPPEPADYLKMLAEAVQNDGFLKEIMAELPKYVKTITANKESLPIGEFLAQYGPQLERYLNEKRSEYADRLAYEAELQRVLDERKQEQVANYADLY